LSKTTIFLLKLSVLLKFNKSFLSKSGKEKNKNCQENVYMWPYHGISSSMERAERFWRHNNVIWQKLNLPNGALHRAWKRVRPLWWSSDSCHNTSPMEVKNSNWFTLQHKLAL